MKFLNSEPLGQIIAALKCYFVLKTPLIWQQNNNPKFGSAGRYPVFHRCCSRRRMPCCRPRKKYMAC